MHNILPMNNNQSLRNVFLKDPTDIHFIFVLFSSSLKIINDNTTLRVAIKMQFMLLKG